MSMPLPLRPPPAGVTPNFDDPEFVGLPVLIAAGLSLFLVVFFASVRIYARVVVIRKWRFEEYVFFLTCALGLALTAFSISIVQGLNGYHAWDIDRDSMTKGTVMSLMSFWITLGPVFWLLKLNLFMFLLNIFKTVRWFKNCVYVGMVVTGLVFSVYTIIITMSCNPRSGSEKEDYLHGLNRPQCTSPSGLNAIVANITTSFNGAANLYILLLPFPLISELRLPRQQMRGVYFMHGLGVILCVCSLLGAAYRIKSWQTDDLTGAQVPHTALLLLEISISIVIVCMPSTWVVWRHFTVPDIDDRTTIATPNMKLISTLSSPQTESRATWRKTHLSIEEIPYRQASIKWNQRQVHHSRMKKLPTTPLPLAYNSKPTTPITPDSSSVLITDFASAIPASALPSSPNSVKSMHLPIMLSPRARAVDQGYTQSVQSMDLHIMLSPRALDQAHFR